MNTNRTHWCKDLVLWQNGIALAKLIDQLTKPFRSEERLGLLAEIRRPAGSNRSNIAEGQARHKTGEFIQFISHAESCLAELDTQLILSVEVKLARAESADSAAEVILELRLMLNALPRRFVAHQ
jgi:four helix bundle protein